MTVFQNAIEWCEETASYPLKVFVLTLLFISTFFWSWAFLNTVQSTPPNFDLGLVSFGSVIVSSCYVLALVNMRKTPGTLTRRLTMASHLLVAHNYMLGAYLEYSDRPGFAIYCACFAVIWFGVTAWGALIMSSDEEEETNLNDENNDAGEDTTVDPENQGQSLQRPLLAKA